MYGKRLYLGFSICALGAAVALMLSHLGHDVSVPVAMVAAALGAVPIFSRDLFRIVAERLPPHLGPVALYGLLAHRLAVGACIVLHLISASISAAGVGILAMLPIGARMNGRIVRSGLALA